MEKLGEDDVIVVKGASDSVSDLLKAINIKHKEIAPEDFKNLKLDPKSVLAHVALARVRGARSTFMNPWGTITSRSTTNRCDTRSSSCRASSDPTITPRCPSGERGGALTVPESSCGITARSANRFFSSKGVRCETRGESRIRRPVAARPADDLGR